ncbi:MAG: hypothetical protein R3E89_08285 [Thiolinea sp.]
MTVTAISVADAKSRISELIAKASIPTHALSLPGAINPWLRW